LRPARSRLRGVQKRLGAQGFAAFQRCLHGRAGADLLGQPFDLVDLFAQAQRNAHPAHLVLQGLGDLRVEKPEDLVAAFHQGDLHAQGRQHAGIFDSDHPPADDNHGFGNVIELEQLIGSENGFIVEGHGIGPGGTGPGGDDDRVAADNLEIVRPLDVDDDFLLEFGGSPNQFDAVALELVTDQIQFGVNDLLADVDEIGDGDGSLDAIAFAKKAAPVEAGQVQDGLAQGLGGNGAGVDGRAAEDVAFFDDADRLAEFRSLNGRFLAARSGADHNAIEMPHVIAVEKTWIRLGWFPAQMLRNSRPCVHRINRPLQFVQPSRSASRH